MYTYERLEKKNNAILRRMKSWVTLRGDS